MDFLKTCVCATLLHRALSAPTLGAGFLRCWRDRAPLAVQLGLIYGNAPPENPGRYGRAPALALAPWQGSIAPVDASSIPEPL
jgi:hypothetical protein